MRAFTAAVVLGSWIMAGDAAIGKEEELPRTPSTIIKACVHRGQVYTLLLKQNGKDMLRDIHRHTLGLPYSPKGIQSLRIRYDWSESLFHIWDDTLFCTRSSLSHQMPLKATRLSNFATASDDPESPNPWNTLSLGPVRLLAITNAKTMSGFSVDLSPTDDASSAFTVGADRKLFVFLAWKEKMRLWTGRIPKVLPEADSRNQEDIRWDHWTEKPGRIPNPKPLWQVQTHVEGPFFAYQDKDDYLFVTDKGEVHCLPSKGNSKGTMCLWKDPRRPVRLLVEDTASGTTWAFAPRKDPKDKTLDDIFFALAKKIEPIKYDPTRLSPLDRRKPLETALAHARFLVTLQKIDPVGKPSKPRKK
jgi:hypothetical protein